MGKKIVRWLLVLPSSFIAGALAPIIINIFFEFIYIPILNISMGIKTDGIFWEYNRFMVTGIASGFLSLYVGAVIAPNYKKRVTIALSIIYGAVFIYQQYLNPENLFLTFSMFIGFSISIYYIYNKNI